jgi:hypothetical protein
MKMPAKPAILMLLATGLRAWSQPTPPSPHAAQPSVSDIAASFTNYEQITKSVVFANPEKNRSASGQCHRTVAVSANVTGISAHPEGML